MKKNVCIALFLSFLCFGAFSQSADKLTEMLNAQTVTIEQLSYFAANYLNLAGETATGEEALSALKEHIDFSRIQNTASALSAKDCAYLCCQVWGIRGGIMFRITKLPRYAFRELKALEIIPASTDPYTKISGRDALYIMTKCAQDAENNTSGEKEQ